MSIKLCRGCQRPTWIWFCRSCRAKARKAVGSTTKAHARRDREYWDFSRSQRQDGGINLDGAYDHACCQARDAWDKLTTKTG